jgi:hypothetical protein
LFVLGEWRKVFHLVSQDIIQAWTFSRRLNGFGPFVFVERVGKCAGPWLTETTTTAADKGKSTEASGKDHC